MNPFQTQTEFYKQRDLGEKINATIDFALKNYKEIIPLMLKKVLPIILIINIIPAFLSEYFITNWMKHHLNDSAPFVTIIYYIGYFVAMIFAQSIVMTVLYKKLIVTSKDESEYYEVNEEINGNFVKIFITGLLVMLIAVGFSLMLFIPGIIVGIMLSYAAVVAVIENVSPVKAISRCWSFGFTKWWSTFGLILIVGIICTIVNMILSIPEYVFIFMNATLNRGNVDPNDIGIGLIYFIVHSVSVFGGVLLATFTNVALSYQYANIREIKESVSLNSKISKFDEL